MAAKLARAPMLSPGRPPVWRREHRQKFWDLVGQGLSSEEAGIASGVSQPVGTRLFRDAGGMRDISTVPLSGRFLSFVEREEIALLRVQGAGVREIARSLGRAPSTISRELRRNASSRSGQIDYRAINAQWHSDRRARRPKAAKLVTNERLHHYVQDRLDGAITRRDGSTAAAPAVGWKKRRHGPRQDRRWSTSWSPEQIAGRLRIDFPDDELMRISHEAIYQALYVQGRGALRRELTAALRTGRALRVPRARTKRGKGFVSEEVMISQRPVEVEDRAVPGHWEGDLILGLGGVAIGTLVERTSRFTLLLHLPPMDGHRMVGAQVKNGPATAGHGAQAVRDAIAATITTLPQALRKSLTWDQGTEMSQHAQLRIETGLPIYFADPHSPWQRPSNENTNGLLRQYFPKGTDFTRYACEDLDAVAKALNERPRKTLGFKTPAEALNEHLVLAQNTGVATTA
jgi:IS30 family transposase